MNKIILLVLLLIMSSVTCAQDMILLRNGTEIQCKMDMIGNGIVSYKENGNSMQLPTTQVYMIKYAKRGNAFFNSDGETNYNTEQSAAKLGKKDIAIYLCEGGEIIASEVSITNENINYRAQSKKPTAFLSSKKSNDWITIAKDNVFLIRYFDGTREVINDLQKLEALPKVKHPFIPVSKDPSLPRPADILLNGGKTLSVIIYDLEDDNIHYRKKEWQDGPIFRINRSKINKLTYK